MIIVSGLLCTGFCSCNQDENVQSPDQAYEQAFTGLLTRTASNGDPEHGDTYRIMAYSKTSNGLIQNTNQSGSYAYDLNGDYSVGSIVPVAVNNSTYQTSLSDGKLVRNGANGLHLTAGDYYVSMIHPCVPVHQASGLGYLAVFNRTDKVYASQPLDKNGDETMNPFEISVASNRQWQDANGVVMHPLMSAISVYFYSRYYAESDTNLANPLSIGFTVEETKLVNVGNSGWYNPMQEMVYPNYNYKSKTVYSKDVETNGTENEEPFTALASFASFTDKDGKPAQAKYAVETIPVFPSDYRGPDMGGSAYVIPMTLQVKLRNSSNNLVNKASIPVSIEIKRNKLYRFYINFTSEQIKIAYTVADWNYQDDNYTDLGGDLGGLIDYATISWNGSGSWSNSDTNQQIE